MLFNSFGFLVFFIVVTTLFFTIPNRFRWSLLLFASCFFYMFFKPEYILILAFTIVVDYFAGILIESAEGQKRKQFFLIMSLVANIGVLAVFKYYNFINDQVTGIARLLGYANHIPYLIWILPIGLSFHTFQAMSYTIEVYRGNQKSERHFGIYSLYVMFYPQLVSGPIERPQNMLHQFHEEKHFSYENLFYGLQRIIWGIFKKVVIADRLAMMVDYIYKDPYPWHGLPILLAVILFAFQIYCDFSGYSDIAVGTARVMGYKLMENFNYPFRSRNITEFWRRWHISLYSWFNDYLFTPVVINKRAWGSWGVVFALLVTFSISGLWHGANWTFILFGVLHGLAVSYEFLTKKYRKRWSKKLPVFLYGRLSILITFCYACITWIFFRSTSVHQAVYMLKNLFKTNANGQYFYLGVAEIRGLPSTYMGLPFWQFAGSLMLIPFLFFSEWLLSGDNMNRFRTFPVYLRWAAFYIIILSVLILGVFDTKQFIYFQF